MTRRPRIITKTVNRLLGLARSLERMGKPAHAGEVMAWADELDSYDARETKKDPSKRKPVNGRRKKAKARNGRRKKA